MLLFQIKKALKRLTYRRGGGPRGWRGGCWGGGWGGRRGGGGWGGGRGGQRGNITIYQ